MVCCRIYHGGGVLVDFTHFVWCVMRDGRRKKMPRRRHVDAADLIHTPNISANGWIDTMVCCSLVLDSLKGKLWVLEAKESA